MLSGKLIKRSSIVYNNRGRQVSQERSDMKQIYRQASIYAIKYKKLQHLSVFRWK